MKDDILFNIKFVQLIQKYRQLYDDNEENYSNRIVQTEIWNQIGKEVNEPGASCKDKWKNIRSSFRRYMRAKALNKTVKASSKYYLANYLDFLVPFSRSQDDRTTFSVAKRKILETDDEDSNVNDDEISKSSSLILNNTFNETQKVFGKCDEKIKSTSKDTTLHPPIMNERFINSDDYREGEEESMSMNKIEEWTTEQRTATFFEPKRSKISEDEEADSHLHFIKSLLPDMRRMNAYQIHQFKLRTLQTIGVILYHHSS